MAESHSDRANELAGQANRALHEAMAAADRGRPDGYAEGLWEKKMDLMWQRVRAIQAQAQIHATLTLNDTVSVLDRNLYNGRE